MRYSQNDEQECILRFFSGRVGRFLEIGGFDGETFSNTRALLEHGWSGHIVEPDPFNLCKLLNNLLPFKDRVEIVGAAIGAEEGIGRLHMDLTADRGWASILNDPMGRVLSERQQTYFVPVLGVNRFLCFIPPVDFISIDAELMDFDILKAMGTPRCELLCVEPRDNTERQSMMCYLSERGFVRYHETPENLLVRAIH